MGSLTIYAREFDPYQPVSDQRRAGKAGIMSGQNFLDDVDGFRSAYTTRFYNYYEWDLVARLKVTELRVGGTIMYGTPNGVWAVNSISGLPYLLIPVNVVSQFWPWTVAECAGIYYFAQYNVGLWQYDSAANTVVKLTGGAIPFGDNVRGVIGSYSRLAVLSDDFVAWSEEDDGTDFTPSLITGAGAQATSLIGGVPLNIAPVADGIIIATTLGLLKGEFVDANYVYRWYVLSRDVKLFSPNGAVVVPDVGVIYCDDHGMHVTNGAVPAVWEPLMGEYFKLNIIRYLTHSKYGTMQLYYSQAARMLFVSFSSNAREGLYDSAFVYYTPSGKWGVFNHTNTGVFEVIEQHNSLNICAYMDVEGYMQYFYDTNFSETYPSAPQVIAEYVIRPISEQAVISQDLTGSGTLTNVCITELNYIDYSPTGWDMFVYYGPYALNTAILSDATVPEGEFSTNEAVTPIVVGTYLNFTPSGSVDTVPVPYIMAQTSVNSTVTVGPFRLVEQKQADETSAITSIILGLTASASFSLNEDWNILTGDEDWNILTGNEDWGIGSFVPDQLELSIMDTDDGYNPQAQGEETLDVQDSMNSSLYYTPTGYSAIYHTLTLNAFDIGDSFYLKFIDIAGISTGRHL